MFTNSVKTRRVVDDEHFGLNYTNEIMQGEVTITR